MSRHPFPFFGITPKRLICRFGIEGVLAGPNTRPNATCLARYVSITDGCSVADGQLDPAGLSFGQVRMKADLKTITKTI